MMLPATTKGLRVGLLGGSFNPAHEGHRQLSLLAMKRLKLDFVWWLVTPGNPLKSHAELIPLALRCEKAREVALHPRIIISDCEAQFKTRYTIDTLRKITALKPEVSFFFLMGADNLAQFHRWKNWEEIAALTPLVVVDRPQNTLKALASRAARALPPSQWCFVSGLKNPLSSTQLRSRGF